MNPSEQPKVPAPADDPEVLARELDLELLQQRASRQKTEAKRATWRALSLLFLLLLGIAALCFYFYVVPQLRSRAAEKSSAPIEADR